MSAARQLHIGLMLGETWRARGAPAPDKPHSPHELYIELSKSAENAKLDFVFKPDTLAQRRGLGRALGMIELDPMCLLSALARETSKIGLVSTASTTFNPPYVVARQLQSMQWISDGRAGWNIVTSLSGAENFGDDAMPSTDLRYRKAAEFTDVVRQLWSSHPHAALSGEVDCEPIDHKGEFLSVAGPLNIPEHPAGPPPLFQAGASDTGRDFAASVADAIFASTPHIEAAIELRTDLQRRAERHGRPRNAVRVLPGFSFFLAPTREEARDMQRRSHAYLTHERRCELVRTILGLDLSDVPPETPVTLDMLPGDDQAVLSNTHADLLRHVIKRDRPTAGSLLARPEMVWPAHWTSVGTVEDVLADIVEWFEADAIDGFIALPGGSISSLHLFLDELVPALAELGLFRTEYEGVTLKDHLRLA